MAYRTPDQAAGELVWESEQVGRTEDGFTVVLTIGRGIVRARVERPDDRPFTTGGRTVCEAVDLARELILDSRRAHG